MKEYSIYCKMWWKDCLAVPETSPNNLAERLPLPDKYQGLDFPIVTRYRQCDIYKR